MNKVRDREQLLRPVSNEHAEPEQTAFENAPTQEPPAASSELEASTIQMKVGPSAQGGVPYSGKKGSSGLPADIQSKAEAALKINLSGITLVENSSTAAKIGALAFVRGREMHFAPGQYQPNTEYGRAIIYHEIGHLVPTGKGDVAPTIFVAGLPINDDPQQEALADELGRIAAQYTLPKTKQLTAQKAEAGESIQAKFDPVKSAITGKEEIEKKDAQRAAGRIKEKVNGSAKEVGGVLAATMGESDIAGQEGLLGQETAATQGGNLEQGGLEASFESSQHLGLGGIDAASPADNAHSKQQDQLAEAMYRTPAPMQEICEEDETTLEQGAPYLAPVADQVASPPPVEGDAVQAEGDEEVGDAHQQAGGDRVPPQRRREAKSPHTVAPKTAARDVRPVDGKEDAALTASGDTSAAKGKTKPKAKQPDASAAPEALRTPAPKAEAPVAKVTASPSKPPKDKSGSPKVEGNAENTDSSGKVGSKRPRTAAADPEFQGVVQHVASSAETQATHDAPEADVADVEGAAVLPQNEQKGEGDRKEHLAGMEGEAKEPKRFEAATFKEKLKANLTQLEAKLPKDSEGAEKFKKDKPIDDLKEGIQKDVQGEKDQIAGPLEKQAKKATPPPAGLPTTPEVPLQAKKLGKAPTQLNAAAAIPKRMDDAEISLDAESGQLDDMMAQGELTDEQLAKSNEPSFLGALESKNAAKAKAKAAPGEYRGKEAEQLAAAKGKANAAGEKGLAGMHEVRLEKLQTVQKAQKSSETAQEQERAKVKAQFTAIYDKTKAAVTGKLEALSNEVTKLFDTEAENAKKTFEQNVEERLDKIYGWTRIDDWIFGEDKEAIAEAFRLEKETFIQTMDRVLDRISVIIADGLNAAMDLIAAGRAESKTYYDSLDSTLKAASKADFDAFNGQYDALEESVREKENELAQGLAQSYEQNVAGLEATFEEIKQQVSAGWIDGAIESIKGVIDTINKLRDMFSSLLSGAMAAIEAILNDPIGFLSNLIDGVKQGFLNFGANIQQHLMTGLVEWLTGTLSGAGITVPEDVFSLGGIFNLSMQVMGLTYDYFRGKAVNLLGEPVVAGLETTVELFNAYRAGGPGALWEEVKDQFGDIKEVVIDAIKEMVVTQVMNAGIKWIMGLLSPVGAFIKAAMAIVDLVQFFMQRAAQIMELVQAFIQGIRAIAAGNVAAMAAAIERALGRAVPVLIGFLASLLGLGDLSAKVEKIINKIRKRIDKEIERVIKKMKKFAKNVGKGKAKPKAPSPDAGKEGKTKDGKMDMKEAVQLVKAAANEADQLLKTVASKEEGEKAIQPLKKKYKLTSISLLSKGKGKVQPKASINPDELGNEIELSSEEKERKEKEDRENDSFESLLYQAMKRLGVGLYKGYTQEEIQSGKSYNEVAGNPKDFKDLTVEEDKKNVDALAEKKHNEINKQADGIVKNLQRAHADYSSAAMAKRIPNNVFRVNGHGFFVNQAYNFYVYPEFSVLKYGGAEYWEDYSANIPAKKDSKGNPTGEYKIGPKVKESNFKEYNYKDSTKIGKLKEILMRFPASISTNVESTLFLAAFIAETSRHSTANLSHLLAVNNPEKGWEDEKAYGANGKLSMADGGTNPGQDKLIKGKKGSKKVDERLDHGSRRAPAIVTTKDLNAVKENGALYSSLKQIFKNYTKKIAEKEKDFNKRFPEAVKEDIIKRFMKKLSKSIPV